MNRALTELNAAQSEAVTHGPSPLLVLAGAGSGKTRVITHRIAHRVASGMRSPHEIVALTFTNRAAREMRERAAALVGPQIDGAMIRTFHSACARWLRQYARYAGLSPSFSILDDDDQIALLRPICESLALPHDRASMKGYRKRIDEARNRAQTSATIQDGVSGREAEEFAEVYSAYEAALLRSNSCDFGSLILSLVTALQDNERLRDEFRSRYPTILVDEFQDTNLAQYRLLQLLAPKDGDVTVVGDDDQSIYRWRGATVENVRRFTDEFEDCHVVPLERNYRSTPQILDAANAVVEPLIDRMPKRLYTEEPDGEPITIFVGRTDREEADFIARRITGLQQNAARLDEIAIFYRTNAQSRVIEERLRAAGIPHEVFGGQSFFDRREVRDVLAFFRLATNPRDDAAFLRVVNVPPRGIGKGTLGRIAEVVASGKAASLVEAAAIVAATPGRRINKRTRAGLNSITDLLDILRRAERLASPQELVEVILTETQYIAWLEESEPETADDRIRNVDEIRNAAADFRREFPEGRCVDFLEHVTLRAVADNVVPDTGNVRLMTVHTSKGLEFPTVFMTGMEEELFPLERRGRTSLPEETDEERRLCYVALTRAKERLVLSACEERRLYAQPKRATASPFLREIPESLFEWAPESSRKNFDWNAPSSHHFGSARDDVVDLFDQRPWQERLQQSEPLVPSEGMIFDDSCYPEESVADAQRYAGRRAMHRTFGEGRILSADPTGDKVRLTILFPEVGEKKVILRFVELMDE